MRSQIDAKLEQRGKAKKPTPVPGGKALQRLLLYFGQRDPRLNDDVVAAVAVPKSARPKFLLTARAMRAKVGRAVKASRAAKPARGRGASPEAHAFASAIMKAAIALAGKAPRARTATRAAKARGTRAAAAQSGGIWQPLGPLNIPNGQTYGSNKVDVIGRVSCIAVDPSNPVHLLLGSAGGGIWEYPTPSFPANGDRWAPRSDFLPSLAIGAIAFDPSNPKRVYAGSGEGNFYYRLGAGVYKSTNGGTTWSVIATAPFVGVGFYDLVVHPMVPATLYAATTSGFYVSLDSGATWSLKRNVRCWDISAAMVGAQFEILAAFQDGLFVSINNGNTFAAVVLPAAPAGAWDRLAVDQVKNAPTVAYAFGAMGAAAHLWRRTGAAWTKITTLPAVDTGQSWYDWYVAATPTDQNEVYLGEKHGYRGNLAGVTWTWTPIVTNGANSIHPDQHCLTFSPASSSTIFAGNDGGIFQSTNKGATWTALNATLGITEIEYMAGNPNTWKWLMAGTQDNGTIRYTGSVVWDKIAAGDGGDCGVNQTSPNVVYHSFYLVSLQRSITAGNTWTNMVPPPPPPPLSSLFYPPVEVAGLTVAIGANSLVYSQNGVGPCSTLWLGGVIPSAMLAMDPTSILIGATNGVMRRVTFTAGVPSIAALATPSPRYISRIAVDPSNPNRYWVTMSQLGGPMVYRSDNAGSTWVSCQTAGLPNIPMNSVVVDPGNYKRVFVSGDVGVYESTNLGGGWAPYGTGLPNAMAADLLLHAQDRMLICGMRNRGAWAIAV